jgi:serine/threonine protein kinase
MVGDREAMRLVANPLHEVQPLGIARQDDRIRAVLLEQLLRQSKARRVHPRHFSLPGDFSGVARTLRAGDRVGPYQVEELLKLGGMSQIYRVTDTRTGRSFALKLLPLELARDPVLLLRFEEEAQNLKTLKHPHVASLVDLGEDFGDRYLVLDLALGGKIGSQSCSDLSEVQGPLPEKLIIEIGKQVCDGLHYVHSQGIVHRDLKPGNLLVAGDRILITDFGISRARGTNRITLTGMPVGTAEYMAPEQLQEKEVDHRADIYSLGCTLYELATGRPPYHADTPLTTALHHLQAAPLRVDALNGRISRGLSNIIFKAIQKRPQLRYQSAWQLFEDLARFQQDPAGHQVIEGEQTPQDAREEAARGKARFKRRLLASAAALLILVAAGFWGEKAVRGWRLHRSLDQAQSVWSQGKARWPEVCQILARLYEEAPAHPEVQAFLHQISATGSLVVRAQPPGATIQVVPRPDEDRSLGISLEPRVLQGRDPAGTGGRFVLAPGHYQVSIALGKLACEFPVFISQSRYEATVGGWKEGQRLRPEEVAEWQPAQQKDSNGFTLAEEQTIGPVVLIEVPEGYSYVTPGPFWYSLPENLRTAEKLEGKPDWFKALGARQFNWRSADLEEGFLIGQDEVSVEEFDRWFRRFGREAFEWPGRWQTRRLLAIAEGIPPEVLEKCWGVGPGDRSGENGRRRTREEVCEAKARSDPINQKWIEYHEKLRQSLEVQLQGDRKLPVVDVNFDIALTYARTHDLEPAGELKAWLASEVRSSKALLARLAELEGRLAGDNAPDIEASSIPRDIQVPERRQSPRGSRRINLLEAYGSSWIYSEAEFASQVPVQAILVWATANKDRLSTFRGRLVEIGMKLSGDPWFHFVRDDECRNLVHTYVKELGDEDDRLNAAENEPQQPANSAGGGKAPGRPLIEREHFRRWLGMRIREETGNLAERAKLLGKLEEEPGVDRQSLEVPWEFRLEYGRASGRSLPSIPQWERAFRGADTRRFPWGNSAVPGLACTGPHREGPRSLERYRVGGDRSPYGVWSLAGNVSEWVLPSPELRDEGYQFLKGGNWFHSVIYADAGCLLAIQPMLRGEYAGFRVIRTIRALAVEPVAVSSGE